LVTITVGLCAEGHGSLRKSLGTFLDGRMNNAIEEKRKIMRKKKINKV
jgi:hypothetical protein